MGFCFVVFFWFFLGGFFFLGGGGGHDRLSMADDCKEVLDRLSTCVNCPCN